MRPSYIRTADAPARPTDMSPVAAHVLVGTCGAVARPSRLKETSTVARPAAIAVDRCMVRVKCVGVALERCDVLSMCGVASARVVPLSPTQSPEDTRRLFNVRIGSSEWFSESR